MRVKFLSFTQPIGDFALTVMPVTDILRISHIERREFDQVTLDTKGGPQREASISRINEISRYSETADATFPTPILLALPEDSYVIETEWLVIQDTPNIASVVDGQHRLLGLAKSKFVNQFQLPVVFLLGANEEQKALIFAIINGKQTRVSASVIYDLFSVVKGRNPFKTAHEIARALNSDEDSPFYRRLKMLGRKITESNESLSQGTFVTQLVKHISTNPADDFNASRSNLVVQERPSAIFNEYFLSDHDEVILKILLNLFNAVREVFPNEWDDSRNYILVKTTGYTGIMRALPAIYKRGLANNDLTYQYFLTVFDRVKSVLDANDQSLTSSSFPPNSSGESRLRDAIVAALNTLPFKTV